MFNVAIPTYRRPEMLRRALQSLVAQTEKDWEAFIFDDSPDAEGMNVARSICDDRIHYSQNVTRMGGALNIDECFGQRLAERTGWGCVLEDDNFYLPTFLECAADVMRATGARVALFNQRIKKELGGLAPEDQTTRGDWFAEGWLDPRDLHASLLLMEGLSNGGIVWRIDPRLRLNVGPSAKLSLDEACRSLLIQESVWFNGEALAVWTERCPVSTPRDTAGNRLVGRGQQSIVQFVLENYGWDSVARAIMFCATPDRQRQLVSRLLHSGAIRNALRVNPAVALSRLSLVAKGLALRLLVEDPFAEFLNDLRVSGFGASRSEA
jgi:hypothetical protein